MRRRDFTSGLLLAAAPRSLWAQERAKKHRIAILEVDFLASIDEIVSYGARSGSSCAAGATSKDRTLPSIAIPSRVGPKAMSISLARSSNRTPT
jgi:hypothetical protein